MWTWAPESDYHKVTQLNQRIQPHGSLALSVATSSLEYSIGAWARMAGFQPDPLVCGITSTLPGLQQQSSSIVSKQRCQLLKCVCFALSWKKASPLDEFLDGNLKVGLCPACTWGATKHSVLVSSSVKILCWPMCGRAGWPASWFKRA